MMSKNFLVNILRDLGNFNEKKFFDSIFLKNEEEKKFRSVWNFAQQGNQYLWVILFTQ